MNKQELIEHINNTLFDNLKDTLFIEPTFSITESAKDNKVAIAFETEQYGLLVGGMLKKFEKVTIPWFIANWIALAKKEGYNIRGAIEQAPRGDIEDWLELENVDIFAEAWVNGYHVDKEKMYLVNMKGIDKTSYLNHDILKQTWFFSIEHDGFTVRTHHTRKELEEAGFGEVFTSPLFEVEEVEE